MSMSYAPGDVAFYCIDYGGGSLSALQRVPHVASVAARVDPERISRTVNDVRAALNHREAMFREHGPRVDGRLPPRPRRRHRRVTTSPATSS